MQYVHHVAETYGSVLWYIEHKRLRWDATTPSGDAPFSNLSDYKVLYNDWPYLVEDGIKHLVVWTKFLIDEDPETGKVTGEINEQIEAFIKRTFCGGKKSKRVEREQIVWFKNWKSLKSVHALGKYLWSLLSSSSDDRATAGKGHELMAFLFDAC